MGFLKIILLLAVGAQCLPFPGTAEEDAAEALRNKTQADILAAANVTEEAEDEESSVSGVRTDHLARRHTWKFLFDQAFTGLHAEGSKFTEAAREVFEKTSGRLGYIYSKSSNFIDALKQYLSRSVGFTNLPKGSDIASNAGRDLYVQALSNLRGHVFQGLTTKLIQGAANSLGANHSNLGKGIVLLGLSTSVLVAWLVTSWCVKKCQDRRKVRKEKKERREHEAGDRLIRNYQDQQGQSAQIPSAQFSALNYRPDELSTSRIRGNQGGQAMYELAPRMP